ncbi:MAG TPA: hypothetical protein PLG48_02070 [Candidatus Avimonas sp.]|nr:hypothetical protein [Candidatus Avimonas sp.]
MAYVHFFQDNGNNLFERLEIELQHVNNNIITDEYTVVTVKLGYKECVTLYLNSLGINELTRMRDAIDDYLKELAAKARAEVS